MVSRLIVLHLMVYGWVYGADGQPKLLTDADDGDKKVIGNGIPTTYGSLNLALSYKGFDVSVMFRGAFNFQVLNRQRMHWETTSRIGEGNLPRSVLEKPFGSNSYVKGASCYAKLLCRRW